MTELLGCPFCGEERIFLNPPSSVHPKGSINCPACLACMPGEVDEREMVASWNQRAALPEAPAVPLGAALLASRRSLTRIEVDSPPDAAAERDIYEVANHLAGYVDDETPQRLADFLMRESEHASGLADEIVRLRSALQSSPPVKAAAVDGEKQP